MSQHEAGDVVQQSEKVEVSRLWLLRPDAEHLLDSGKQLKLRIYLPLLPELLNAEEPRKLLEG